MQVLEQWCTQKHSSKAQIYLRKVWEGWVHKQWRFGAFLYRKKTKLAVGDSTNQVGG